ncbi:MAG: TonB family protein, partial [Candidatus Sulfotelmatobacter sp.]
MKSRRLFRAEHKISSAAPYPALAKGAPDDLISSDETGALPPRPSSQGGKFDRLIRENKKADQVIRADAAVDLVLEQIVYQTRLSTCATGAFIGLTRNGQMVYRALNGATSAEFIAYLRRDARMVEACLRSSSMQHVHNSDNSSELDVSVCRSVGARSIVLFPVLNETSEKLGVLGAFSPQADAFGAGDLVKIQSLSHRVADTLARVNERAGELAGNSPALAPEDGERRAPVPADRKTEAAWFAVGGRTWLTLALILGVLLLVGWELTRTTVPRAGIHAAPRNSAVVAPTSSTPVPVPSATAMPVSEPVNPAATATVPARVSKPLSVRTKQTGPDLQIEESPDDDASGIVLFEGKEVKPRSTKSSDLAEKNISDPSGPVMIGEQAALDRLVNRVEPEYPDEAKAHHVQGQVVLDVLVNRNGKIERLSVLRGDPGLKAAAADAVGQWRFKPFARNGHPASFETQVTLT